MKSSEGRETERFQDLIDFNLVLILIMIKVEITVSYILGCIVHFLTGIVDVIFEIFIQY